MNRILIIDDNPAIHSDFKKILAPETRIDETFDAAAALIFGSAPATDSAQTAAAPDFEIECASQGQEALAMVQQARADGRPYCMAFVDIRMPPGWDGVETLTHLWEEDPELQAVLCSAYSDYTWADISRRLARPAHVLMLKKPFDAIEAVQMATLLTEKWHAHRRETAHRAELNRLLAQRTAEASSAIAVSAESQARFAMAFESSPVALAILDARTLSWTAANPAFLQLTGSPDASLPAARLFVNHPGFCDELLDPSQPILQRQIRLPATAAASTVLVSRTAFTQAGQPHLMLTLEDISSRVEAENKLRQAQKMEAVGQLAAGLAHDFNNIMTVILGHVTTCQAGPATQTGMAPALEEIRAAGVRAAALTKQLLAFGRKQVLQILPVDPASLLEENRGMLSRLVGAHIPVTIDCPPGLPPLMADHNSFNQILLNLAINARDAFQNGGSISISAALSGRETHSAPSRDPFIHITFRDDGPGMDELTRAHIFEPFFTTKPVGEGTGLGLSSIHGIMAQHGGWIECESSPGRGAAFHLYFPTAAVEILPAATPSTSRPAPVAATLPAGGGFRVLVVEDEHPIRRMLCAILQRFGFQTLDAPDANAALALWDDPDRPVINALFTDIVMPGGLSGLQLAQILLARQPDLRVVFSSGYSTDLLHSSASMESFGHYLPKPYDLDGVSRVLKNLFPDPIPNAA